MVAVLCSAWLSTMGQGNRIVFLVSSMQRTNGAFINNYTVGCSSHVCHQTFCVHSMHRCRLSTVSSVDWTLDVPHDLPPSLAGLVFPLLTLLRTSHIWTLMPWRQNADNHDIDDVQKQNCKPFQGMRLSLTEQMTHRRREAEDLPVKLVIFISNENNYVISFTVLLLSHWHKRSPLVMVAENQMNRFLLI